MVVNGNSLDELKKFPDNYFDSVVTDPPYGLSFMGKKWDYDVPTTELWSEVLRVLKPGGHMLAFFGTRTYHRGVVRIEDAGFEIRDQIQWIYGSGFPKSHNLKDEWQGYGTALKPANEPIVVARKPLEKGLTVAENVLKWGCGAINVDGCRIGLSSGDKKGEGGNRLNSDMKNGSLFNVGINSPNINNIGRWPANILFDEEAAQLLDEQSGQLHLRGNKKPTSRGGGMYGHDKFNGTSGLSESGHTGASRFFYVAKASKSERNKGLEGMNPQIKKGAMTDSNWSGNERFDGKPLSKQQNHHPTVKPIKLMEYLCKLVTPPTGIVLDPFAGSGSTGVAAKGLGFGFVGIELNEEYAEIARKRIGC